MNFDFTAEQYELRDTIRAYLDDHWASSQLRGALSGPGLPESLWEGLAQLGLLTVLIPEEHGGLGLTLTDASLLFETFGETLTPGLVAETMLASDIIARFGTAAQKSELLPAIAEGRTKLTMAVGESATSFDPAEIAATAIQAGNGWRLDGHKQMVPFAALADRVLMVARAGEGGPLAFFVVDPKAAGVAMSAHVVVDPTWRASGLTFDGVTLPADALLGVADGTAVEYGMRTAAAASAAQLTGIAGRALGMTLDYAKQRKQFGRVIGSFQAIKHKLADMMVTYETSRSAAYYAHWAVAQADAGQAAAVSLAKAYAGDMSRAVANESVHIHGGIGFTWEYDLHLFLKRAKVLEYAAGDASWHREQYARALIDS
jgi:alkylation response protein AidB-like acyl-CoA dehydrogenase